jgi:hypothetical protein
MLLTNYKRALFNMAPFPLSSLRTATLLLLAVLAFTAITPSAAFLRASGTRFVDENCHDFAFVGSDSWRVVEGAANLDGPPIDGMTATEWMFKTAAENNITVIRMFATGVEKQLPLQTTAGEYNEKALRALDESLGKLHFLIIFSKRPSNTV